MKAISINASAGQDRLAFIQAPKSGILITLRKLIVSDHQANPQSV